MQIFKTHFHRKALARKRNKRGFWTNLVKFESYANMHATLQLPTEIMPHGIDSNTVEQQSQSTYYVPKLMVSNVMSLAAKIDEAQEFLLRSDISLAFITETWLKETIADSAVHIPGNTIIQIDRMVNNHGGVKALNSYDLRTFARTFSNIDFF